MFKRLLKIIFFLFFALLASSCCSKKQIIDEIINNFDFNDKNGDFTPNKWPDVVKSNLYGVWVLTKKHKQPLAVNTPNILRPSRVFCVLNGKIIGYNFAFHLYNQNQLNAAMILYARNHSEASVRNIFSQTGTYVIMDQKSLNQKSQVSFLTYDKVQHTYANGTKITDIGLLIAYSDLNYILFGKREDPDHKNYYQYRYQKLEKLFEVTPDLKTKRLIECKEMP